MQNLQCTVWKFKNFSATTFFCEINCIRTYEDCRHSNYDNFDFDDIFAQFWDRIWFHVKFLGHKIAQNSTLCSECTAVHRLFTQASVTNAILPSAAILFVNKQLKNVNKMCCKSTLLEEHWGLVTFWISWFMTPIKLQDILLKWLYHLLKSFYWLENL